MASIYNTVYMNVLSRIKDFSILEILTMLSDLCSSFLKHSQALVYGMSFPKRHQFVIILRERQS